MRNWGPRAIRAVLVLLPLLLAACQTFMRPCGPDGCDGDGCPRGVCDPKVLRKPTVHAAACDLDHLERHIDWHGSVTAKVPDVWGQARLTLYREQFEQQMEKDLDGFKDSLQGAIARQDQAFLLSATAISAALETPVRPYRTQTIPAGRFLRGGLTNGLPANPKDKSNVVVVDHNYQTLVEPDTTKVNPAAKLPGLVVDKDGNVTADSLDVFIDRSGLKFQNVPAGQDGKPLPLSLSLEPERYLEQKKRYLDLLAQIRRTNEGDDTADSPGYSLQLFRIPVSVLPGKRTDSGHGAEITMTLTPVLGDDLLPTTFRSLVINDLVYQLGFPITQALNPGENQAFRDLVTSQVKVIVETITQVNDYLDTEPKQGAAAQVVAQRLSQKEFDSVVAALESESDQGKLQELRSGKTPTDRLSAKARMANLNVQQVGKAVDQTMVIDSMRHHPTTFGGGLSASLNIPPLSFATGTDSRTALPTSQLVDVYGTAFSFEIALAARQAFEKTIVRQKYAHLPDVQSFLKEELNAAYELLSNPQNHSLWDFCRPDLVHLIRTQAYDQLDGKRREFRLAIARLAQTVPDKTNVPSPAQLSRTAAFAWGILVDAALLTDRLCKDMKSSSSARGACIPGLADWMALYLPTPPRDVCDAFNAYVRVRWPIHVFALDPAIQEQNLADRLSTRRELQLALSLAFSHGFMSFNQLSRYARRLEAEYETIDVNRTQVGFNHGSDTFGWRFYPRYQTPDTPSNLTLIARDLFVGGPNRNQLLRQRRLEPGPRECVALVVMPSFVPAVTLDTTSNFFGLANPKHKVFDHTQAVELGKTVQAIKTAGCGLTDAHCYRDGDASRLVKRAEQLEARLPMQTVTFPAPTEGALAGFELFGTSTTSLSPELFGFYGAPGIAPAGNNTLFLVGDHFSPLRTRVIVGNQGLVKDSPAQPEAKADQTKAATPAATPVRKVTLLSRQVMQIDIPSGLQPIYDTAAKRYYYTVHVATPYGVSRELLVPVSCPVDPCKQPEPAPAPKVVEKAAPAEGYKFGTETLTLPYCKDGQGNGSYALVAMPLADGIVLDVAWSSAMGTAPLKVKNLTLQFEYKKFPFAIAIPDEVVATGGVYRYKKAQIEPAFQAVLDHLKPFGPFADETNPLTTGLEFKGATLTPVEADPKGPLRAVVSTPVGGSLTLKFPCSICPPKKADPKPGDKKTAEQKIEGGLTPPILLPPPTPLAAPPMIPPLAPAPVPK